ncbi:MAG: DUF5008 domain-containing protein, partial [Pedobacter sp.]
ENAGTLAFKINVNNPSNATVNLVVKPAPFSTANSSDFTLANQTINITPTTTSVTVNIPIIDDTLEEQMVEYFVLSLENPVGATLSGETSSTVYIVDNDKAAPVASNQIQLNYIGSFDPSGNSTSSTEIVVHDAATQRLFTISSLTDVFDIINFANPLAPSVISTVNMLQYGGITSIAVKNGIIAVASPNGTNAQGNGSVVFFDINGTFLKQVSVGVLPDMITFSPDGTKVMTANEGEPNDAYTVDPEGSISIIDIPSLTVAGIQALTQTNVTTLSFTQFNGQEAEIKAVTAAGITAVVPGRASSGVTSFVVDGQLVFGPEFTVVGKVNIDPTYVVSNAGADNAVLKAIPLNGGNLMLLGSFTNYDNKGIISRINRIARVFPDGTWDRSFQSGAGANGTVTSMASLGGYFYLGGSFSGYAQQGGGVFRINKMTTNGVIDTVQVTTYEKKTRFVPRFNGGVQGTVNSLYAFDGKIIATGDFNFYVRRRFDQPSYKYLDSTIIDSTDVRQLARFDENGKLDSTWRFDKTAIGYRGTLGKSLPGANGTLRSLMHDDGKILCWGFFTTFDNANVGRIVRLNSDGTIDPTFNPGGAGANDNIDNVTYDKNRNKYIVVGRFSSFNGTAAKYMTVLNFNGTVDQTFKIKEFIGGGQPLYGKELSDGLIVVSGDFRNYDGVIRNGFMILNPDGTLADGYNTTGNLSGSAQKIFDIYETKSADNKRALLIMGSFYSFDNKPKNNIVRVTLE